jgi:hypothetical protein
MIFPKHYNTKYIMKNCGGIILIDMLLALSLGLIFIIAIMDVTAYSRSIFYKAKNKNANLDTYENSVILGNSDFVTRAYGNYREEMLFSSSSLMFDSIYSGSQSAADKVDQHALCSVDFSDDSVVGSYQWMKNQSDSTTTYDLTVNIRTYLLSLNPAIPLTDLEVRDNMAYISSDSNSATDPDIYVFRLENNKDATLISSLNTGPGIGGFVVAGNYIYAVAPSTAGQLHVIKQNSTRGLSLVDRYRLPLPYATATPALGSSIAYEEGKVFLGTEKWAGEEFSMIDVSNPLVPERSSGIETGGKISDIFVNEGRVYISGVDQQQLRIVDIHDPSNVVVETSFSPLGWQRQEGKISSIFEGRLDFGRTAGGYNVLGDHEAFTIATSNPFIAANFKTMDMPGGVYGIISDRLHEFIITRQAGKEFQIFDHTMSSSSSVQFSLPTSPQTMTCYGNKIYILSHTYPAIYAVTITRNHKKI